MRYWLGMLFVILILGMGFDKPHGKKAPSSVPFLNEEESWADSVLATLSLEEKLGQLLFFKGSKLLSAEKIKLYNATALGRLGGLMLSDIPIKQYMNFIDSCQQLTKIPLMVGTAEQGLLNNQFSDLVHLPNSRSLRNIANDSLLQAIDQLFIQQARGLGINWRQSSKNLSAPTVYKFNQNGILNFESAQAEDLSTGPSGELVFSNSFAQHTPQLIKAGLSGMFIASQIFGKEKSAEALQQKFRGDLKFEGLLLSNWEASLLNDQLEMGVDLFLVEHDPTAALFTLRRAYQDNFLTESLLNQRVKKILMAKFWSSKSRESLLSSKAPNLLALQASVRPFQTDQYQEQKSLDRSELAKHFTSPKWELFKHRLYEEAVVLANNPNGQIPFITKQNLKVWEFSEQPLKSFRFYLKKYSDFTIRRQANLQDVLPEVVSRDGETPVIVLDNYLLDEIKDEAFLNSIRNISTGNQLVIINYGRFSNLNLLPPSAAIIQLYERNNITESLGAQVLFGAFQAKGQLPAEWQEKVNLSASPSIPIRLKYGIPQEVGIDPARLVGIDAIAGQAIKEGVMPGCQVLVAKEGKIIYNKAFGHHTYKKSRPVNTEDIYDLASITKVSATTLALMQLYEQKKISLNDPLGDVLTLPKTSSLKNISLKKLMTHQSGLQIYMPVAPYLLFRDQPNAECDSFFCKEASDTFSIKIADNFYFKKEYQQKIWEDVGQLPVYKRKSTRYSDVNFYLLQKVIEEQASQKLDQLVDKDFYQPMGLRYTAFNPTNKFDKKRLVPTELDKRWRQQIVQGYVHDETAALLGGVAGHAGLFSTAEDLAVIFQMLLNGGHYGGKQYLAAQTIELFTSRQYGTSRGLGFDKPSGRNESTIAQSASAETFGHTGFTGTCVWADPEEDLVFIFLSNRVHPVARNPLLNRLEIRRRMHQVVYDALDTFTDQSLSL